MKHAVMEPHYTKYRLRALLALCPLAIALGFSSSCSSSGDSGGNSSGDAATLPGSIEGTVTYAGTATGTLYVGATEVGAPPGPPAGVAPPTPNPVWPQAFKINDLPPGKYALVAYIDLPPLSSSQPDPKDPSGVSEQFEVKAGVNASPTFTIQDPK